MTLPNKNTATRKGPLMDERFIGNFPFFSFSQLDAKRNHRGKVAAKRKIGGEKIASRRTSRIFQFVRCYHPCDLFGQGSHSHGNSCFNLPNVNLSVLRENYESFSLSQHFPTFHWVLMYHCGSSLATRSEGVYKNGSSRWERHLQRCRRMRKIHNFPILAFATPFSSAFSSSGCFSWPGNFHRRNFFRGLLVTSCLAIVYYKPC